MLFNKQKKENDSDEELIIKNTETENSQSDEIQNTQPDNSENEVTESESGSIESPYKFSEPVPYPKNLVSVLGNMLKKLFPDTKKAYLILMEYNGKSGYLLVVDIDPQFLKIINLYLEGETEKVRGNMPIQGMLYSKSGTITNGIEPFYKKQITEAQKPKKPDPVLTVKKATEKNSASKISFSDMPDFEINSEPEPDGFEVNKKKMAENKNGNSKGKHSSKKEKKTSIKPTNERELFTLINKAGLTASSEVSDIAKTGLNEFKFYIPFKSQQTEQDKVIFEDEFPKGVKCEIVTVINSKSGKRGIPLFTNHRIAEEFAIEKKCFLSYMKYRKYTQCLNDRTYNIDMLLSDGIVINPGKESLFLPLDYSSGKR